MHEGGAGLSAAQIAGDVRSGRRTPVEVLDACLARTGADDGRLGAFQVVDVQRARSAALELAQRTDLAQLALAGVPVAIKDNVAVAGLPTRHGSAATPDTPAVADDELVRRLRAAGAVVVGKTRLPELAIWGFTESIAHGGTRNPRDPARNAGGSTGGGAAAVAAGMVAIALGSDGGGSLRIPAANCGVVGFKPARGVLPLFDGLAEHWYGCSVSGPIANSVTDVVLAMDVLAGGASWRAGSAPASMTVAVSLRSPSPIGRPDAASRAALQAAAAAATAAGHTVVRADPPYPTALASVWGRCWLAGIAEDVQRLGLPASELEPRTRSMLVRGQRLRRRGRPTPGPALAWTARATAWLGGYDVLLSPVVARPAPPMGWGTRTSYLRAYLNGARGTPYTQAWNVAGFPALSLPVPLGGGVPGAVQLVAVPGREATLLALATQLAGQLRPTGE